MSVLSSDSTMHGARPFQGQGASLYVTSGSSVAYRRLRLRRHGNRSVLRQGWEVRNPKTLRVASDTGVSGDTITFAHDISGLAAGDYTADVRHYRDDIENLVTNAGTVQFEIDSSGGEVQQILGTVTWLAPEIRAGGIVRLRWVWHPSESGVQPDTFRVAFTDGPTSPSDLTTSVQAGVFDYELDTAALSDDSAYTVTLSAELSTVTATLASGKQFTADASGPPAPTLVSISAQ